MNKYLKTILNSKIFLKYVVSGNSIRENDVHINNAVTWLLNSQKEVGSIGYAHSYNFVHSWQDAYPETTGYIIPSLLDVYRKNNKIEIYNSVELAVKWLKKIQNADGSFNDLNGKKQIFDVGQILIGFNYLYQFYSEFKIKDNLLLSLNWLLSVQNEDGSFTKYSYNNIPHTYYSRVGAAVIKSGYLLNDKNIIEKGMKNIEWTMKMQLKNGFFKYSSFSNHDPYLHTMIYILEGLFDAYELTQEDRIFKSILKFSNKLLEISIRDGILYSQYDENYNISNKEYCMTGLAQWVGICYKIFNVNNNVNYKIDGDKTLDFVKLKQIVSSNKNLSGGIMGSIPFYGKYMGYSIPNWGIKFFIDALLEEEKC
ncbi:terpene cyclase/mutase family protein [Arcobacter sp. KX21116]|uniref:prenyltransferase/squalene oxidase repeat-containing protein n=1 Tax=Arcobacter iocasae TaxID=2906515 RepID=UPI0035D3E3BD